ADEPMSVPRRPAPRSMWTLVMRMFIGFIKRSACFMDRWRNLTRSAGPVRVAHRGIEKRVSKTRKQTGWRLPASNREIRRRMESRVRTTTITIGGALLGIAVLMPCEAHASDALAERQPPLEITPATGSIVIDARLDEPAW